MRFIYLDEAGIGRSEDGSIVTVAGVIVNADLQLKAVEKYLSELADSVVKPQRREGFFFHAKDLWHGSGAFPREEYSREFRHEVLRELCSIPLRFNMPLVMGMAMPSRLRSEWTGSGAPNFTVYAQALASITCAIGAERYMRGSPLSSEVAAFVYENNDDAKKLIRDTHNFLRGDRVDDLKEGNSEWTEFIPFRRIAESPLFAMKAESSLLQIADAVVFVINRKQNGYDTPEALFDPLNRQLVVRANMFGPRPRDHLGGAK